MRLEEATAEMQRLCDTLTGHELHRAVDALMCDLMRQQGYGEAVDIFLRTVEGYHVEKTPQRIYCPVCDDMEPINNSCRSS